MASTTFRHRRELARRMSDGIDVALFWSKATDRVWVEVVDSRSDEAFAFHVEASAALAAFNHPYAYAASGRVWPLAVPRAAGSVQTDAHEQSLEPPIEQMS